jgi:hypothetical protein
VASSHESPSRLPTHAIPWRQQVSLSRGHVLCPIRLCVLDSDGRRGRGRRGLLPVALPAIACRGHDSSLRKRNRCEALFLSSVVSSRCITDWRRRCEALFLSSVVSSRCITDWRRGLPCLSFVEQRHYEMALVYSSLDSNNRLATWLTSSPFC